MTREQMISELKSAGIRAIPTVMTYDMGLQYDYITPEGAGTGFGGMGRWPLWRFNAIPTERWNQIKEAIADKTLTLEMLNGTGLDVMLSNVYLVGSQEINYPDYLSELLDLDMPKEGLYCLHDTGMMFSEDDKPQFYLDEDEAKAAFVDGFCYDVESWDDMDDETLTGWFERLHDDLDTMAYMEAEDGE